MDIKQEAIQRLKTIKSNNPQLAIFFNQFDILFVQDITPDIGEDYKLRKATPSELNIVNTAKKLTGNFPYFIVREVTKIYVIYNVFYVSPNEENWEEERVALIKDEDGFINPTIFEVKVETRIDESGNQENTAYNKYKEIKINLND